MCNLLNIFNVLTLIGGLCLFLFGMNIMGQALERRAGSKLRDLLGKLTSNPLAGLLTGLGVTAIIQSSSATTVMVVGFVNSGIMTLKQAISVIMGANIGTTVTAWILSLGGIDSSNLFVQLLKPSSFTPVLALFGIVLYMFLKNNKKKDTGLIFLGFATLMFGMETMSDAVAGLEKVPAFTELFLLFKNPILGVIAGAILTAILQSSSASVGILQALAVTGKVSYGAAIPIIMGQNIGTCITAMLSSVGANKNAKRAAVVHLSFNVIGTLMGILGFCLIDTIFTPALFDESASLLGIAVAHSLFNLFCTVVLFPCGSLLEKLVCKIVPDSDSPEKIAELDERLLATPPIAMERCRAVAYDMANDAVEALQMAIGLLDNYSEDVAEKIRALEDSSDRYEDILGSYLVKLSTKSISDSDSNDAAMLLKLIGDLERISDHAVGIVVSAEEMRDKKLVFSDSAVQELKVLSNAVSEVCRLALEAFLNSDIVSARNVEPLDQLIDSLKETLRTHHINRLQQGGCSIEAGFVWSDLLTDMNRVSGHCSNIAGCVLDMTHQKMNLHESLRAWRTGSEEFAKQYEEYSQRFSLN
jgi:phosphate:Na+ symporter